MSVNKWIHEYASGESSTTFPFPADDVPAKYAMADGAGTVVLVCTGGVSVTRHMADREVLQGEFISLTSTTCTRLVVGNVAPPIASPVGVESSTGTSLETRLSTEESARASGDTSLSTRVSTEASTRASADTSLTTRISTAESVEASTH